MQKRGEIHLAFVMYRSKTADFHKKIGQKSEKP